MNESTLSPEQQHALSLFKQGKNMFITGAGGTGKTKLIHHLVHHAKINDIPCQVCALTGCATLLLQCNARTLHSWSGIKLAKGEHNTIVSNALKNKTALKAWKKTRILIVDEVSMLSQKIFEIIEDIARMAKRIDAPFGGIQVIFTGDFFQLPPVGNIEEVKTINFCFQSPKWKEVFSAENHIQLTTMFRQKDPLYANILLEIRQGSIGEEHNKILQTYVKRTPPEDCVPTKLFAVRIRAEQVNAFMFSKLKEEIYEFHCDVKTNCKTMLDTQKALPLDVLHACQTLTTREVELETNAMKNNMPCSPVLALKKGAFVMCVVNYDMDSGICNGSQGVIVDFIEKEGDTIPLVKFTNGMTIPIDYHYWQNEEYPTIAVGQIPLCLCWAMTIHKMQGATLSMAEIDVGHSVFEYGQIYVALSRIRSLDGLFLLSFHPHKIKANPAVIEFYKNMVVGNITDNLT